MAGAPFKTSESVLNSEKGLGWSDRASQGLRKRCLPCAQLKGSSMQVQGKHWCWHRVLPGINSTVDIVGFEGYDTSEDGTALTKTTHSKLTQRCNTLSVPTEYAQHIEPICRIVELHKPLLASVLKLPPEDQPLLPSNVFVQRCVPMLPFKVLLITCGFSSHQARCGMRRRDRLHVASGHRH